MHASRAYHSNYIMYVSRDESTKQDEFAILGRGTAPRMGPPTHKALSIFQVFSMVEPIKSTYLSYDGCVT